MILAILEVGYDDQWSCLLEVIQHDSTVKGGPEVWALGKVMGTSGEWSVGIEMMGEFLNPGL